MIAVSERRRRKVWRGAEVSNRGMPRHFWSWRERRATRRIRWTIGCLVLVLVLRRVLSLVAGSLAPILPGTGVNVLDGAADELEDKSLLADIGGLVGDSSREPLLNIVEQIRQSGVLLELAEFIERPECRFAQEMRVVWMQEEEYDLRGQVES